MLFYQIPAKEEGTKRLKDAEVKISEIKEMIQNRAEMNIGSGTILSDLIGLGYKLCNKTEKFYAEDSCISCGLCEKNCPQSVIILKDGKPQWTKPECTKCGACISRCPVQAIQYGKATKKRNRYVNPGL